MRADWLIGRRQVTSESTQSFDSQARLISMCSDALLIVNARDSVDVMRLVLLKLPRSTSSRKTSDLVAELIRDIFPALVSALDSPLRSTPFFVFSPTYPDFCSKNSLPLSEIFSFLRKSVSGLALVFECMKGPASKPPQCVARQHVVLTVSRD